jgi:hypothetical protein
MSERKIMKIGGTSPVPGSQFTSQIFFRITPMVDPFRRINAVMMNVGLPRPPPDPKKVFAEGLEMLKNSRSYDDKSQAVDLISIAALDGADITPALELLHKLSDEPKLWFDASIILAEHYIARRATDKVVELLCDPLAQLPVLYMLETEAMEGKDVREYVPFVCALAKDSNENIACAAMEFIFACIFSINRGVRSAVFENMDIIRGKEN